jgi:hypothetical protein
VCKFPPEKLSIQNASAENSKTKESLFKIIPPLSSPQLFHNGYPIYFDMKIFSKTLPHQNDRTLPCP